MEVKKPKMRLFTFDLSRSRPDKLFKDMMEVVGGAG